MTAKIRSLVMSGACCMALACADAAPPEDKKPKATATSTGSSKQSALAEDHVALATTARERPASILDGPSNQAPEPARSATGETSKKDDAVLHQALADARDHAEPKDYDRPLSAAEVKVERFVLATGVEHREPVGESDVFTTDTPKIFAFMQLANPDADPYAIRVHWEPLQGPPSPYGVELKVETMPRYRTWSWTAIERAPGTYRAVLRTLDGEEIASRTFTIEHAAEAP